MQPIVCPWCGTNYAVFQPNCKNCGGPLSLPRGAEEHEFQPDFSAAEEALPALPPPPRPVADSYAWRLLLTDGWTITAGVFALIGGLFTVVGLGLIAGIITAIVGVPFAGLGLLFLAGGGALIYARYQRARQVVDLLRSGAAARGEIVSVRENLTVRVNHQHPWIIAYRFQAGGAEYQGELSTLNTPGRSLQPGRAIHVLYTATNPMQSTLYPHP